MKLIKSNHGIDFTNKNIAGQEADGSTDDEQSEADDEHISEVHEDG